MAKVLKPSKFETNQLFYTMVKYIYDNKNKINPETGEPARINILNEGGSRSGKSFDSYALLIYLCDQFRKTPISIYVVRKTLKSARDIAYQEDFVRLLNIYGLYRQENARNENQSPEYTLWGSTIQFKGLDGGEELGISDVIYINEALDIENEKTLNNLVLRCEKLFIADWNPKYSDHFLFKWNGRFNTLFTKTTFVHNKYIKSTVRAQILSYSVWDFKDFDFETGLWKVPVELRSPHTYNIENGTANLHDWLVYGEGMRCPEEGAVFKNINWIDTFPDDCDEVHFGLDFGYTSDPSVLTKVGRKGKNVYIKYLTYSPFDNTELLYQQIMPFIFEEQQRRINESEGLEVANIIIACDSADKFKDSHFVRELNTIISSENKRIEQNNERSAIKENRIHGIQFIKVKKPMITVRLNLMKKFILNVVKDKNAVTEFDNYTYMMIEGRPTNIPIDKWNHGIDSSGYCMWQFFRWYVNS